MVLSKQEIEESLAGGPTNENHENMFGLAKGTWKRWPNGVVPYTIANSISKLSKQWEFVKN